MNHRIIIILSIITILIISGCTQTTQDLVSGKGGQNTNNKSEIESEKTISEKCDNCLGMADICKEYKCIDGTCAIVELSNCCGNNICEDSENYGNCSDCTAPYMFERINHTSCAEDGKVKFLEFGNRDITADNHGLDPLLKQLESEYNIEIIYHHLDIYNIDEFAKQYNTRGVPTLFLNCYIKYLGNREGKRDIESLRSITEDVLSGYLI